MKIDLHSHSTHSDGRESVEQIFQYAAEAGLNALALTDHDTTAGWDEARFEAAKHGITFVPGIELTTESPLGKSVHLLAYLPDPENTALVNAMNKVKADRYERLLTFIAKLQEGYPALTLDQVIGDLDPLKVAVGKPHLADALIALGEFDQREIQFMPGGPLHKHSPYYVENRGIPTLDAIKMVRDAGGVPVLAHPLTRGREEGQFVPNETIRSHFIELINAGLGGFEVWHREVDPTAREWLIALADEFNLVTTGSSDYHGKKGKPNLLGENTTPESVLRKIEAQATGSTIQWAL